MMPTHFDWNVSQVLANLSLDTLYHPSLREKPTKVWLPKLHLKQQLDLVATLSQLGKGAGDRVAPGALAGHMRRGLELAACLSQR